MNDDVQGKVQECGMALAPWSLGGPGNTHMTVQVGKPMHAVARPRKGGRGGRFFA